MDECIIGELSYDHLTVILPHNVKRLNSFLCSKDMRSANARAMRQEPFPALKATSTN